MAQFQIIATVLALVGATVPEEALAAFTPVKCVPNADLATFEKQLSTNEQFRDLDIRFEVAKEAFDGTPGAALKLERAAESRHEFLTKNFPKDPVAETGARFNLGLAYRLTGKLDKAITQWRLAYDIEKRHSCRSSPWRDYEFQDNLGLAYAEAGRYYDHELLLLEEVEITSLRRAGGSGGPGEDLLALNASLLAQLANVYLNQGLGEKAEEAAQNALSMWVSSSSSSLASSNERVITTLAEAYLNVDKAPEALALLDQYKGEDEEACVQCVRPFLRAFALEQTGHITEATKILERLFDQYGGPTEGVPDPDDWRAEWLTFAANSLAETLQRNGNEVRAATVLESALSQLGKTKRLRSGYLYADLAYRLARSRLRGVQGRPAAQDLARWTFKWLESARGAKGAPSLVVKPDTPASWQYTILADAEWGQPPNAAPRNAPADVVASLQMTALDPAGDAMVAAALKSRAKTYTGQGSLAALLEEIEGLHNLRTQARLRTLEALNTQGPGDVPEGSSLNEIDIQLADRERTLRDQFPQAYALQSSSPVPAAEIQPLLAEDEALLLVIPAEFGLHRLVLTRTDAVWSRSSLTYDAVEDLTGEVLSGLRSALGSARRIEDGGDGPPAPFPIEAASRLSAAVFSDLEGPLTGKSKLLIVSTGPLSLFPFGALPLSRTPEPGDLTALRGVTWAADRYAIAHLPTLRLLLATRNAQLDPRKTFNRPFIGFGNPLLSSEKDSVGPKREPSRSARAELFRGGLSPSGRAVFNTDLAKQVFSNLPETSREIEGLRSAFGASPDSVYLGRRNTETNAKTADLQDVAVVAFATHGIVADELGNGEAGLIFTPPEEPNDVDDGFLSASEVAQLNMQAEWVILSACNTAVDQAEGPPTGISYLSRAFAVAGGKSVLASLWPVLDSVAPLVTVRSVELMNADPQLDRRGALSRALAEIRNNLAARTEDLPWSHPAAWAPFLLIGDTGM